MEGCSTKTQWKNHFAKESYSELKEQCNTSETGHSLVNSQPLNQFYKKFKEVSFKDREDFLS